MTEAKQALADPPAYHRVPLHYRNAESGGNTTHHLARSGRPERNELDMSVHALQRRQEEEPSQSSQPIPIDLETEPPIPETPNSEAGQFA
jgi:hypothetical protein